MCIKNRLASLIYKCFIFCLSLTGVYLISGIAQSGGPKNFLDSIKYFVMDGMLMVVVYYFCSIIHNILQLIRRGVKGNHSFAPWLKGGVVMIQTVVLISYQVPVVRQAFGIQSLESPPAQLIAYLILPLATFLDWLLFDTKGSFSFTDPLGWLSLPLMYYLGCAFASILGVRFIDGSYFPYSFLDYQAIGWVQALINLGIMGITLLILFYLFWLVDYILGQIFVKPHKSHDKAKEEESDKDFVTAPPAKTTQITKTDKVK